MNKLIKLYSKLNKNNSIADLGNDNSSAENVAKKKSLYVLIFGLIVACGLGYVGYKFSSIITLLGGSSILIQIFGLIGAIVLVLFGFISLINSLYMSSDIEILISLPFSSVQIATIRILSFIKNGILITLGFVVPVNIGYAIVCGITLNTVVALLLSCILVPIFVTAVLSIILILIMSFIRLFRNKDVLKYIGIACGFILICIFYVTRSNTELNVEQLLTQANSITEGIRYIVPTLGSLCEFVDTGNWLYALGSIAMTAISVGVFYLVAKLFYLRGALNMQDTANAGKILEDNDLDKYCKKNKVEDALFRKEYKMVRRNPVYTLSNFVIGFLWPILVVFLFSNSIPTIQGLLAEKDMIAGMSFELFPFYMITSFITGIIIIIGGMFLIGYNIAYSSISREGKSYYLLKQIPISYITQLKAKMKLANRLSQVSITGYVAIILVVFALIIGFPIYYVLLPIVGIYIFVKLIVAIDMLYGLKNANVNWDNEKMAIKKDSISYYIIYFILWLGVPAGMMLLVFFMADIEKTGVLGIIIYLMLLILMLVASIILTKKVYVYGEKRMRKLK